MEGIVAKFVKGKGKDQQTYETGSKIERVRLLASGWSEVPEKKASARSESKPQPESDSKPARKTAESKK